MIAVFADAHQVLELEFAFAFAFAFEFEFAFEFNCDRPVTEGHL